MTELFWLYWGMTLSGYGFVAHSLALNAQVSCELRRFEEFWPISVIGSLGFRSVGDKAAIIKLD